MTRTLIAGMLALSLAFTGFSSAPARADDTAKVLAGLATLFIIAKVVEDNRRRHRTPRYARSYVPRTPRHYRPRYSRRSRVLPAQCLARSWTRNGWVRYYGSRCLRRFGVRRRYPEVCRTSVWTPRGWRAGYSAYCLGRRGFRVARIN